MVERAVAVDEADEGHLPLAVSSPARLAAHTRAVRVLGEAPLAEPPPCLPSPPGLQVGGIVKDGEPQRFCQQCGRFHLDDFDGNKRRCREVLQRYNARRSKRRHGTDEPAAAGSGARPCCAARG
jgi:hypothetical protein